MGSNNSKSRGITIVIFGFLFLLIIAFDRDSPLNYFIGMILGIPLITIGVFTLLRTRLDKHVPHQSNEEGIGKDSENLSDENEVNPTPVGKIIIRTGHGVMIIGLLLWLLGYIFSYGMSSLFLAAGIVFGMFFYLIGAVVENIWGEK